MKTDPSMNGDPPMNGKRAEFEHPNSKKHTLAEDVKNKREKPLAIKGTLDDVLRAAMSVKPKDEQVKSKVEK